MPRVKKRRTCAPPKTVSVKGYYRKSTARRRRKRSSSRKAPAGPYWTCVDQDTGRRCGTHHKSLPAAHAHSRKLDGKARARYARFKKRFPRAGVWTIKRVGG